MEQNPQSISGHNVRIEVGGGCYMCGLDIQYGPLASIHGTQLPNQLGSLVAEYSLNLRYSSRRKFLITWHCHVVMGQN